MQHGGYFRAHGMLLLSSGSDGNHMILSKSKSAVIRQREEAIINACIPETVPNAIREVTGTFIHAGSGARRCQRSGSYYSLWAGLVKAPDRFHLEYLSLVWPFAARQLHSMKVPFKKR